VEHAPSVPSADDKPTRRRLGDVLVEMNLLTRDRLDVALGKQRAATEAALWQDGRTSGTCLGTVLLEEGAVNERDLATALGAHFGVGVTDLRQHTVEPQAIQLLSEASARSLLAVPLRLTGTVLEVAVADPTDELTQQLQILTGMSVTLLVASGSDIRRTIDRAYRALAGVQGHVDAFVATSASRVIQRPLAIAVDEKAPVVQVVTMLLTQASRDRASDIHIEPMDEGLTRVRFRIDGALHDILTLPGSMGGAVVSRLKVLAGMNIVERRRAQDGQFTAPVEARDVDVRVSSTGTVGGEKVVLRLLDKSKSAYLLSELGMAPDTYRIFSDIVRTPYGMVICAGPTGSGKTTSLYATIAELNGSERNIMTIEDPVEYVVPSINQIQINEQAGITFASGLRSILRQDPDIILVGEIRDGETARIAVQAALTGHLVLSSLHATDTASALLRLLEMDVESYIVGSAVSGVVSQRLLRRICDHCRQQHTPTSAELDYYLEVGAAVPAGGFWEGAGCTFCSGTGYQDRIGVYELLRMTPAMRRLIATNPAQDEICALAVSEGTRTLRQEAIQLVANGVTTIAEVIRGIYVL
jgi:type IV pilus assembly protein PilB